MQLSNSPLQPWIDYANYTSCVLLGGGEGQGPPIQQCSENGIRADCATTVCLNRELLFDTAYSAANLVTCASWATMCNLNGSLVEGPFSARLGAALPAFETLGFDIGNWACNTMVNIQGTIASCFADIYGATHALTNDVGSVPQSCTADSLFN